MAVAFLLISTLLLLGATTNVQAGIHIRTFRGSEQSVLEGFSARELLNVAAKYGSRHIALLTAASQTAVSQEGAEIAVDCLPWLNMSSQLQDGTIQWKFIQLDEYGNPASFMPPQVITPNAGIQPPERIKVGGLFNRWLNITHVNAIPGAKDPDSKIFMCEVCSAHGTPSEQCNSANFTLKLAGAPPMVKTNLTKTCLSRYGDKVAAALECDFIEQPYPQPKLQRSWYKDGKLVYSAPVDIVPDASDFLAANPLLTLGVLNPQPIHTLYDGTILLSNQVENITSPSMLPPGIITLEQAKEKLYSVLLGNWTCQLNNTLGNASHTYVITECVPRSSIPVPKVEALCSIVAWESGLSDSSLSCEDIIGYDVRLYHPESEHQNLTRRVETDKTYYRISDEDKRANINHETHVQIRIVHKYAAGRWSQGTPIGCKRPTETPSGMYFEINEKVYLNNSFIHLSDIGEGDRALLCKTDRENCCGTPPNRYGEFYYPNGVSVPIASRQQGFYRNRGEQVIRLNRRSSATSPTGKYRCAIPEVDGEIQSIYVTLIE